MGKYFPSQILPPPPKSNNNQKGPGCAQAVQRLCHAAQQRCQEQPGVGLTQELELGWEQGWGPQSSLSPSIAVTSGEKLSNPRHHIHPTSAAPSPSLEVGPTPGVPSVTGDMGGWVLWVTLWAGAHSKHRNTEIRRRQEPP